MLERFWAKVNKTDSCWLWEAYVSKDGYGQFALNKKTTYAHRYAYEQLIGPIPKGLTLDHICRIRRCVNPAHLEVVSKRENTLRGIGPPGLNFIKTHCNHNHPFTIENTYIDPKGHRRCRICRQINYKAWASVNRPSLLTLIGD